MNNVSTMLDNKRYEHENRFRNLLNLMQFIQGDENIRHSTEIPPRTCAIGE